MMMLLPMVHADVRLCQVYSAKHLLAYCEGFLLQNMVSPHAPYIHLLHHLHHHHHPSTYFLLLHHLYHHIPNKLHKLHSLHKDNLYQPLLLAPCHYLPQLLQLYNLHYFIQPYHHHH